MSAAIQRFYNRVAVVYPILDLFIRKRKKKLVSKINALPAGNLLEIGVGNGSHLNWYSRHAITGVDLSAKMLEVAKKRNSGARLLEMNGEELSFEDHVFDIVVIAHVLAVTPQPERMLREAHRVLKPGGQLFILNHFTPRGWAGFPDKIFNYFSGLFHFKPLFYASELQGLEHFDPVTIYPMGGFSYFQLFVCTKP